MSTRYQPAAATRPAIGEPATGEVAAVATVCSGIVAGRREYLCQLQTRSRRGRRLPALSALTGAAPPNRAIQSFIQLPIGVRMAGPTSTDRGAGAARTGVVGTIVAAVAFFDGVFMGRRSRCSSPVRQSLVYILATVVVVFLVVGCCRWVDRRWDDWFSGNGTRIEKRLERMRASRDGASGGMDPAWVGPLVRPRRRGGQPDPRRHLRPLRRRQADRERRIFLGAVAYALPYVAMWSIVGFAFGEAIRATSRSTSLTQPTPSDSCASRSVFCSEWRWSGSAASRHLLPSRRGRRRRVPRRDPHLAVHVCCQTQ